MKFGCRVALQHRTVQDSDLRLLETPWPICGGRARPSRMANSGARSLELPCLSPASMTTIAIVDDNPQSAEAVRYQVEDAGFNPWIFPGKGGTLEEAVSKIKENAQGAIC